MRPAEDQRVIDELHTRLQAANKEADDLRAARRKQVTRLHDEIHDLTVVLMKAGSAIQYALFPAYAPTDEKTLEKLRAANQEIAKVMSK
jgi:hypothetical protein